MAMKKSAPAANPDAYVTSLHGWQRGCFEDLRAAVRSAATLEEVVKWGHLVYLSNGPALLIRAEELRVLFGCRSGAVRVLAGTAAACDRTGPQAWRKVRDGHAGIARGDESRYGNRAPAGQGSGVAQCNAGGSDTTGKMRRVPTFSASRVRTYEKRGTSYRVRPVSLYQTHPR
jgi:hypothetical protein